MTAAGDALAMFATGGMFGVLGHALAGHPGRLCGAAFGGIGYGVITSAGLVQSCAYGIVGAAAVTTSIKVSSTAEEVIIALGMGVALLEAGPVSALAIPVLVPITKGLIQADLEDSVLNILRFALTLQVGVTVIVVYEIFVKIVEDGVGSNPHAVVCLLLAPIIVTLGAKIIFHEIT